MLQVVKIGGCLLTHKCRPRTANMERVTGYGRALRDGLASACHRPIIIVGGGSFGNWAPLHFELGRPGRARPGNLSGMTETMMTWLSIVISEWRDIGVPAYPFVLSSLAIRNGLGEIRFNGEPLSAALAAGLVPVVAGDILLSDDGGFQVFSSDDVAELLVRQFDIRRVTYLTDVEGLLVDPRLGQAAGNLVETVRPNGAEAALRMAGGSAKPDVTGGMATKVAALVKLLDMGISGTIADGRGPEVLRKLLAGERIDGTYFDPC